MNPAITVDHLMRTLFTLMVTVIALVVTTTWVVMTIFTLTSHAPT